MAACAFCYATVAEGAEACPRCGRPVGGRAPVADGPSLTPWTAASTTPRAAAADVRPPDPVTSAPEPVVGAPAPVAPPTDPVRPPGAPWRPPDASGRVGPPPAAPPHPAPAAPWGPPAAPGAPTGNGWPGPSPTEAFPPGPEAPVAGGPAEDLDRSNAIVLVVVSTIVALGLVLIAVLASNGIGPSLDELEGAAGAHLPPAATAPFPDGEASRGR